MTRIYALGDINNDGRSDFSIVKPFEDVSVGGTTFVDLGKVFIVYGGNQRINPSGNNIPIIYPVSSAYKNQLRFGEGGIAAGDFDGDGQGDFIIGTYYADHGNFTTLGTTSLYMGPNHLSTSPQLLLHSNLASDRYCGWAVAAFDTNNDNRDDVVFTCGNVSNGLDDVVVIRDNL